jgi:hypothetical protein
VRNISEVYARCRPYLTPAVRHSANHPFWTAGRVIKVETGQRRQVLRQPACIVASSGMLLGGPSVLYARHLVENPANAIFITGYTDEESPGRRLQQLASGDELTLSGKTYRLACQVRRFGLSGHADAEQLATLVAHFQPRLTFLVHGEKEGRAGLQARLADRYQVHLPQNTERVTLSEPMWLTGQPPYMLGRRGKRLGQSQAAKDITPLAGEPLARLPRLGVQRQQPIIEGVLMRESIPSNFPCFYCGQEKLVTIDLSRRLLSWACPGCGRKFEEGIMNLKQKEVSRLSAAEQELLADLILVSLRLHEPTLDKDWPTLLAKPEQWRHWLAQP